MKSGWKIVMSRIRGWLLYNRSLLSFKHMWNLVYDKIFKLTTLWAVFKNIFSICLSKNCKVVDDAYFTFDIILLLRYCALNVLCVFIMLTQCNNPHNFNLILLQLTIYYYFAILLGNMDIAILFANFPRIYVSILRYIVYNHFVFIN